MHGKRMVTALSAALMLSGASAPAFAQQPAAKPAPRMQGMPMEQGTMGGGMMGGGRGHGMLMVPQMPPGNEKLQFQMRAEMMQRMGEIALKYAERIKEEQRSAPR